MLFSILAHNVACDIKATDAKSIISNARTAYTPDSHLNQVCPDQT